MRILLTNWRMTWFSGSDTFLYTVARGLKNRGHDVSVFTEHSGLAARRFERVGVPVFTPTDNSLENTEFDIIHCHHHTTSQLIDSIFPDVPKIFVCHGVIPEQETPPDGVFFKKYVAVSEEIQKERLLGQFGKLSTIIRQPIDTSLFSPKVGFKFNRKQPTILVLSNYFGNEYDGEEIRSAVQKVNGNLLVVGGGGIMTDSPEEYIQKADIVISLGRGIAESLSCGKPVVVGDMNGVDGAILSEKDYREFRRRNFSGRTLRKPLSCIGEEIAKILNSGNMRKIGVMGRKLALDNHDVSKIVLQLENIYKQCML